MELVSFVSAKLKNNLFLFWAKKNSYEERDVSTNFFIENDLIIFGADRWLSYINN